MTFSSVVLLHAFDRLFSVGASRCHCSRSFFSLSSARGVGVSPYFSVASPSVDGSGCSNELLPLLLLCCWPYLAQFESVGCYKDSFTVLSNKY